MEKVPLTIIGAGAVGLAIAAKLSTLTKDIVVIEKNRIFGMETSSRNSEVIHAGIYYRPGSLKARLCVDGAAQLYRFCAEHGVDYRTIGKIIVASEDDEIPALEALYENGIANGVSGLTLIDAAEIRRLEPAVVARAGILSAETGIIDANDYMRTLYAHARSRDVHFLFTNTVDTIQRMPRGGFSLGLTGADYRVETDIVINAAGLGADMLASLAGIDIDAAGYRISYWKGSYFNYQKASPVSRLIYPVPKRDHTGLGIHATLDMAGRLRFGPDAELVDTIDYAVNESKTDEFYKSARLYLDGLDHDALTPGSAGIRPRLAAEGAQDFIIAHEKDRGLPGLINLIGIESPGLTSSLAIADMVGNIINGMID